MKILLLHNYYQQSGGEDAVVAQEKELLESKGHTVELLAADNRSIRGFRGSVKAALDTTYSCKAKVRVKHELNSFRPDVVHVHNFCPLLSPSVYYACREAETPVVQTLHNFRLICANALLFREGKPCELCLGKAVPWPAVMHACYRGSHAGSAVLASMLSVHRALGTWDSSVDIYIAMTNFSREKLVSGGLPAHHIFVKPNFVFPDPGNDRRANGFALFVGRIAPEKGIATLVSAWNQIGRRYKLKIVGNGPSSPQLLKPPSHVDIEILGAQNQQTVLNLMQSASFLVLPSECYECFPRVIVEAFAKGLPVIASRLGSMAELIDHGRTGLLFPPGNSQALAEAVEWMFTHPVQVEQMSRAARDEFEGKYTADRNYQRLMEIYQYALEGSRLQRAPVLHATGIHQNNPITN